ncbi:MAG: hypothetical protein MI975_26120 [Cytophagales bacterium]|nr:hypothetical protein [Cytophagales bacterium]
METQDFNKDLLDYLYGEMNAGEKKDFEKKLKEDEKLRKELEELTSVRNELETLKDKEVMEPFSTWGRSRSSSWFHAKRRKIIVFKPVTAVAASLLILMLVGYFTNFSVAITDRSVQLGFGDNPAMDDRNYFTEEEVHAIVRDELQKSSEKLLAQLADAEQEFNTRLAMLKTELQEASDDKKEDEISRRDLQNFFTNAENKNAEAVKEYLKLTSAQQQEYFKAMFTQFNNFYQQQRDDDLTFIQNSLYEINHKQELQKQETEKAIASLYTSVNQQGNN